MCTRNLAKTQVAYSCLSIAEVHGFESTNVTAWTLLSAFPLFKSPCMAEAPSSYRDAANCARYSALERGSVLLNFSGATSDSAILTLHSNFPNLFQAILIIPLLAHLFEAVLCHHAHRRNVVR